MGFYKWPQSGLVSLHLSRPQGLGAEAGCTAWLVFTVIGRISLVAWASGLVTKRGRDRTLQRNGDLAQHHLPGRGRSTLGQKVGSVGFYGPGSDALRF